ncbi:lipoprotein releasing system atp-binding protein lold [hydrocarbon metagenome]|uniref:Lipoprotein releasing system atp-binding protein lold n=1 Tax=hydrocarbon metagenome TaxID=938273 RepID=A0A0W8FZW8_9ZZZZ
MAKILEAVNITKSFMNTKGKTLEVLKGIDLSVEENNIEVIIGASGAGKSTLLYLLSGLDKPDQGNVKIKETDIFKLNDEKISKFRNDHIGFVFQFHHLLPEFTAAENIALPQMVKGISLKKATKKSEELLEAVGLLERKEHKPAELSGGEQQRVAVARALANDPDIIFADEPSGNLDSKNSEALHKLIVDIKDKFGVTFVIVTHNPDLVKLGDVVHEIKDGKIFK